MSSVRMECHEAACTEPMQNDPDSFLLALPEEVLHQILDQLGARDLLMLMRTSTAMAFEVQQHSASRLTFRVVLSKWWRLVGIQQLLWAPSGIRLMVDGQYHTSSDWGSLLDALYRALPAPSSYLGRDIQQIPCVSKLCIRGTHLPSLVPTGLAALFPNMHTLQLCGCFILDAEQGSNSQSGSTSKSSSRRTWSNVYGSSSSNWPYSLAYDRSVPNLHTLILEGFTTPMAFPSGTAKVLRNSLTNMTCLKLVRSPAAVQIISFFAAQLTELRVTDSKRWGTSMHLKQLQKLVLPETHLSERNVRQLLGLPSLAHLEAGSVEDGFATDFSRCPCKWQSLRLHLASQRLRIDELAHLPLHSLVQPLRLGSKKHGCLSLQVPSIEGNAAYARMDRLAQHLKKCGVQVMEPQVAWTCDCGNDLGELPLGAQHAAAFTLVAPAFGLDARVSVWDMVVDEQILAALATVYQHSLQQLTVGLCEFVEDMLPVWQIALSGLPSLGRMELQDCCDAHDEPAAAVINGAVRHLAAAMAQQPPGRCIEVNYRNTVEVNFSPFEFAQLVMDGAGPLLRDIEVTAKPDEGYAGSHAGSCIRIKSMHMHLGSSC